MVERLEGHEELGVEESGGVAAVIGAAVLGDDGDDFGVPQQDLAHLGDGGRAGLERYGRRHGGPNPEIALFEMRQEFGAEPRHQQSDEHQKGHPDDDHGFPVVERPPEDGGADLAQGANDDGLDLVHVLGEEVGGEHGGDREGREQGSDQRVAVGARHGIEDLAFNALHREERHEGRDRHRGGEEDGPVHLHCAAVDHDETVTPAAVLPAELLEQLFALVGCCLEIAEYVLDQDHR